MYENLTQRLSEDDKTVLHAAVQHADEIAQIAAPAAAEAPQHQQGQTNGAPVAQ